MTVRDRFNTWLTTRAGRKAMLCTGVFLMLLAPLLGPLPGPGGTILFLAGLGLALKASLWFKRRYVRFKRWKPGIGRWTDWGMRRASAGRRAERAKAARG